MIPPSVPTPRSGAMSAGIDHPTGDAADKPPIETEIQKTATGRSMRVRRAENSEPEAGSHDEHGLPNAARVPSAMNEHVHKPSADEEICERAHGPRDAGVQHGVAAGRRPAIS